MTTDVIGADRLAILPEYRILDQPADDELSAVVWVAATVADVPHATLNLIGEHRQCQLTTVGFEGRDSERDDSMPGNGSRPIPVARGGPTVSR